MRPYYIKPLKVWVDLDHIQAIHDVFNWTETPFWTEQPGARFSSMAAEFAVQFAFKNENKSFGVYEPEQIPELEQAHDELVQAWQNNR